MLQMKEQHKSVHSVIDRVLLCSFVFHLSPIFHTFLLHYAESAQMSVLFMDKRGLKAFQIHF